MIETKLFELRDRSTFILAFAFRCEARNDNPREHYLLRRAGYGGPPFCILLGRLEGNECHYDPYDWACEPWQSVHHFLIDNWDSISTGAVLDGEFLRGETRKPKLSGACE